MKTLAALYCERRRVRPEDFERRVLDDCLYPWARRLRLLLALRRDYFEADLELIRATGRLASTAGFSAEVAEFHYHPANSGRLRREWKLRLSVTRLQQLVLATLPGCRPTTESIAPFGAATPSVRERPGVERGLAG